MTKNIDYFMKENWHVEVTAKKEESGGIKEPIFKFEFQVSATYTFLEIKGLAKTIAKERLGTGWNVTNVALEMVGNSG